MEVRCAGEKPGQAGRIPAHPRPPLLGCGTTISFPPAPNPGPMRLPVAVLLVVALLAGCASHKAPPPAAPAPTTTPPPPGIVPAASQVPLEFQAGFAAAAVDTGFPGGEPSIGVTSKGNAFVSTFENGPNGLVPHVAKSNDGGRTWALAANPLGAPTTADPMLWVDPLTDRIFTSDLYVGCAYQSVSDDQGATWTASPIACGLPGIDHQKVASGPYPAGAPQGQAAGAVYKDVVSFCYNKLAATDCAVSLDGGAHYEVDTIVDSGNVDPIIDTPLSCGGLSGHQHHASDGTIYVPYGYNCGQAYIGVSTDGGLTWSTHRTGLPSLYVDMAIASTPDGMAYLFAKDNNQTVYMARSKDRFATVQGPFRVSPPEVTGTEFTVMVAGSDGRVAFAYLGNTQNVNGTLEDDMPADTVWNLYATMTVDAEATPPTFVTTQVNAKGDPVQRGSICMHRSQNTDSGCKEDPGGTTDHNLLDFIDMAVGPDGRFWIVFTDGCVSKKCLEPGQRDIATSHDAHVSVARQVLGPSLYADKPPIAG